MLGELGVGHFLDSNAIHQTPSKCTKGIAKNVEQILCHAFLNNDFFTTLHSMEKEEIPCFDMFQRLHKLKLNFGLQKIPSFQTDMEFEFQV
jgi:hypothetical protein